MPDLKKGKECCGCTACASVCAHKAITMTPDSLGFLYPEVDMDKCVECGMCEKVCSFNDDYNTPDNFVSPIPFGARLKDIYEVMKSRSGGAFVAFSDWILDQDGIVYGAGFKDHFMVAHKRATTRGQRDEFRGSKYVQSNLDGIFHQVRKDLLDGRWVLFSGTPCQVSGLQSFLPMKLKEKLVTVDIVCHGVPSPQIWHDYLDYIEKKEHKIIIKVDFRDKKRFGWKAHKETFTLVEPLTTTTTTTYAYVFYQHIMQRPSCGECHYCNLRRPADLTLADFWGWERTGSHINDDDKGLSLVLVNTPKGKMIFDSVKTKFNYIEPRLEDCMQGHLKEPTKPNKHDAQFQKDYEAHGFEYVMKKYGNVGFGYKIKKIFLRIVSRLKRICFNKKLR